MPRARVLAERLVIFATGVLVIEKDGQGSAGRAALIDAADDIRDIGFLSRGSAQSARLAALEVLREIFRGERHAGQHPVDGHAHAIAVGFAEKADFEFLTKGIHSLSNNSL